MFGISTPVEGLLPGSSHRSFNADWSFLILGGKAGRVFWFATEKMDKRYFVPNIPRFSKEDGEDYIQHFLDRYVAKGIPFSKIWENRVTHTLVVSYLLDFRLLSSLLRLLRPLADIVL